MFQLNAIFLVSIGLSIISCTSGQFFGAIGGNSQRPPFSILPYYPNPQTNNIFPYLPYPFQNLRPPQPQPSQPPSAANQTPTDQTQPSLPNNNGLPTFFPFPNLNNQNVPQTAPEQIVPGSIDGSNKAVYTILPFNFTGAPLRPQINPLGTHQPGSLMMANKNNPTDENDTSAKDGMVGAMKESKFFLPIVNNSNPQGVSQISLVPITQLFG